MESTHTALSSDSADEIQPGDIYVDAEGEWYSKGTRIFREEIIELFLENLHINPDGTYFIEWEHNRCSLKASDTPLVVARVDRIQSEGTKEEILLKFRHLSAMEPLDPTTLSVGQDNVLYCLTHEGRLPARFSRPAYYQLAEWIREDEQTGGFYLELGVDRYAIRAHSP